MKSPAQLIEELNPIFEDLIKLFPEIQQQIQIQNLTTNITALELLGKVFTIEKLIYAKINKVVEPIQIGIFKEPFYPCSFSRHFRPYIAQILANYWGVLQSCHQLIQILTRIDNVFILETLNLCASIPPPTLLPNILSTISEDVMPGETLLKEEDQLALLKRAKDFIALSLLKSHFTASGRAILSSLESVIRSLSSLNIKTNIKLQIAFSTQPTSFAIIPDEEFMKNRIGCCTIFFTVPFWDDQSVSPTCIFNIPFWREQNQDASPTYVVDRIMRGDFCIDYKTRLLYTPVFIEIMHEFIHILHVLSPTITSKNRIPAKLRKLYSYKRIWENDEEYSTITSDFFSQNKIMGEILSEDNIRFGHEYGICICQLSTR